MTAQPSRAGVTAPAVAAAVLALLAGAMHAEPLSPAERRGRAIFLRGSSADGRAVPVTLFGELTPLAFACAGCHARDGRGRAEGGLRPPDLRSEVLSRSRVASGARPARPAYDRARLTRAITMGIDAAGRRLDPVMPRYQLRREDADDLIAFLGRLGTLSDPGLDDEAFRVGVFLPDGTERDVARGAIDAWAERLSARGGVYTRRPRVVYLDDVAGLERLSEDDEPFVVVGRPGGAASAAVAAWIEAREVPWLRVAAPGDQPGVVADWIVPLAAARDGGPLGELHALQAALEKAGRDVSRERLVRALR